MMVLLHTISKLQLEEQFQVVEGFTNSNQSLLSRPSVLFITEAVLGCEFLAHSAKQDVLAH